MRAEVADGHIEGLFLSDQTAAKEIFDASFPGIRQDLAFWVPADRTAAELVEVVRKAGGKLLRDVRVFDVYAREGQTSLAVRLEFRAGDRTLTDEEIAPQREKIVKAVRDKLEGELRG